MKSWIEIDLGRLKSNVESLRSAVGESTEIIYVVKANAYGHGVEQVARGAWDAGVRWYALAHVSEAREVREVLPEANIMIIGPVAPAEVAECVEGRFTPMTTGLEHGRSLGAKAEEIGAELECHAKIDTGMGRLGIRWQDALAELRGLKKVNGIKLSGICTHFASAEADSRAFFDEQRKRFEALLADLLAEGIDPGFRHVSNSGAVFLEPEADFDGVRPGIMLYGYGPSSRRREVEIGPILQWKARVGQVRRIPAGSTISYNSTYVTPEDTCIAVIEVGYADGFPRALSNRGHVLVAGKRAKVVGTVTMSLLMVDVGLDADVRQGDEAILIGRQGDESIWADELAAEAGTITYEILTGIKPGEIKVVE